MPAKTKLSPKINKKANLAVEEFELGSSAQEAPIQYIGIKINLFYCFFLYLGKVANPRETKSHITSQEEISSSCSSSKDESKLDEDSQFGPPAKKKSKSELSKGRVGISEPLKTRVMPRRQAALKSPMSYTENHEIEENPKGLDKSLELNSLCPANQDLANTSSGKNEETTSGKLF